MVCLKQERPQPQGGLRNTRRLIPTIQAWPVSNSQGPGSSPLLTPLCATGLLGEFPQTGTACTAPLGRRWCGECRAAPRQPGASVTPLTPTKGCTSPTSSSPESRTHRSPCPAPTTQAAPSRLLPERPSPQSSPRGNRAGREAEGWWEGGGGMRISSCWEAAEGQRQASLALLEARLWEKLYPSAKARPGCTPSSTSEARV